VTARTLALVSILVAGLSWVGTAFATNAAAPLHVSVTVDRTTVRTSVGRTFVFRTRITNDVPRTSPRLVAHLNVLSLEPGTYVDPEDWSSDRTRYLGALRPGRTTVVEWPVKAVNSGSIGLYVAVLPQNGASVPPTTGPAVHAEIARRSTLDSSGVLPLALGIPSLLAALALVVRLNRRRR